MLGGTLVGLRRGGAAVARLSSKIGVASCHDWPPALALGFGDLRQPFQTKVIY